LGAGSGSFNGFCTAGHLAPQARDHGTAIDDGERPPYVVEGVSQIITHCQQLLDPVPHTPSPWRARRIVDRKMFTSSPSNGRSRSTSAGTSCSWILGGGNWAGGARYVVRRIRARQSAAWVVKIHLAELMSKSVGACRKMVSSSTRLWLASLPFAIDTPLSILNPRLLDHDKLNYLGAIDGGMVFRLA
jgi:hypothetical protein